MRKICLAVLLLVTLSISDVQGEGFFTNGDTNTISLATNEAMTISTVLPVYQYAEYRTAGGDSGQLVLRKGRTYTGPCELILTNNGVVSFHRFNAPNIATVLLKGRDRKTLSVPEHKTIRILPFCTTGVGPSLPLWMHIRKPGVDNAAYTAGGSSYTFQDTVEICGPVELELECLFNEGVIETFNYYFVEDSIHQLEQGYLLSPTGTFEIAVEKSTDLGEWVPVMVRNTETADTRAFYRLRIQK